MYIHSAGSRSKQNSPLFATVVPSQIVNNCGAKFKQSMIVQSDSPNMLTTIFLLNNNCYIQMLI